MDGCATRIRFFCDRRVVSYLTEKESYTGSRVISLAFSDEFFVIHFLRRDVDSVQQCENVVNSGEKGISYEFSLCNLGRKIGKIRRIVGRRTCAASTPFGEGVRKIREGGDRVEFSPLRYRRCPENSTEYRPSYSSGKIRRVHSPRILALFFFFSAGDAISRVYRRTISCREKSTGNAAKRHTCTHTHTHIRAHTYTHTLDSIFFSPSLSVPTARENLATLRSRSRPNISLNS